MIGEPIEGQKAILLRDAQAEMNITRSVFHVQLVQNRIWLNCFPLMPRQ